MKINWRLRFKNKATLTALIAAAVAFIYQIFGVIGIVPGVSQNELMNGIGIVINLLAALGIVVDPTTAGVSDHYLDNPATRPAAYPTTGTGKDDDIVDDATAQAIAESKKGDQA